MERINALCLEIAKKYGFELTGAGPGRKPGGILLARFSRKAALCLEFEIDCRTHTARLEDFEVPYSSVCQKYSLNPRSNQGQIDQFSPFDDGPPSPTRFSVEEWSVRILSHYLETRSLGYVT
jgi:hypothetical protein